MLWTWGKGARYALGNVHNILGLGSVVHIRPNCVSTKPSPDGNVLDRMMYFKAEICLHGHDFVGLRRAAWVAAVNKGQVNLAQNS